MVTLHRSGSRKQRKLLSAGKKVFVGHDEMGIVLALPNTTVFDGYEYEVRINADNIDALRAAIDNYDRLQKRIAQAWK